MWVEQENDLCITYHHIIAQPCCLESLKNPGVLLYPRNALAKISNLIEASGVCIMNIENSDRSYSNASSYSILG